MSFTVASNPEFLKEGAAIEDFMRPDRVVIGSDDHRATQRAPATLRAVRAHPRPADVDGRAVGGADQYAANAMLATRISFMNELANLAEALGADIEDVRRGHGLGPAHRPPVPVPGAGFGGSCFPKDV